MGTRWRKGRIFGFVLLLALVLLYSFVIQPWHMRWGATDLGIYFVALWPMGFLFWLGLPCLLLIGATTWLSWQSSAPQTV